MAQQEQMGSHAAQLAAHDKILEGVGRALSELSQSLTALAESVSEHHIRDDDAAKQRIQAAEDLERRAARRQWILGIALTLFIALHDHITWIMDRMLRLR